jgi:Fe-S-cluster formation regulator IscX/YfhJ
MRYLAAFRSFASEMTNKLKWSAGTTVIAQELFKTLCTNLEPGEPAIDPRGMRTSQLRRYLSQIEFDDDLTKTAEYQNDIISEWQRLYDGMVNGNIKLPGAEKAGPLTFAKVNDKECVSDLHDKHGRRLT